MIPQQWVLWKNKPIHAAQTHVVIHERARGGGGLFEDLKPIAFHDKSNIIVTAALKTYISVSFRGSMSIVSMSPTEGLGFL